MRRAICCTYRISLPRNSESFCLSIEAQVKEVLAKTLMLNVEQLRDEAKLVEDLGLSSLDRFEVTMNLEERFGIEFTPPEQDGIVTIGDAVKFIRNKISSR